MGDIQVPVMGGTEMIDSIAVSLSFALFADAMARSLSEIVGTDEPEVSVPPHTTTSGAERAMFCVEMGGRRWSVSISVTKE